MVYAFMESIAGCGTDVIAVETGLDWLLLAGKDIVAIPQRISNWQCP